MKIKPYYKEEAVTIYHGDCRQIVPLLGRFDLLLTDPPYGIKAGDQRRQASRTKLAKATDYGVNEWDNKTDNKGIQLARGKCGKQIIFGGNYYDLPPSRCWLVWDKMNGASHFADCELAWTNLEKSIRIKRHQWNGMIRKGSERRYHITQKPLDVIQWCIEKSGDVQTILDPFAGSGTTGLAAKNLGKQAVLIEQEEKNCEIAARRLSQEILAFSKEPKE